MKFPVSVLAFTFILMLISGCEVVRLANGKYETTISGRGDFAAVYGDMIIIRLRNPENENGVEDGYWEWGGKYDIREDNIIRLDMDRETERNWKFYYELRKTGNTIKVIDHRAEDSFQLQYIPAVPPKRQAPPAYPAYQ
jgi:hypothetical protein